MSERFSVVTENLGGKHPYDTYRCTVPVREQVTDDDDVTTWTPWRECGGELVLTWTLSCSLPDPGQTIERKDAAGWANADHWQVDCTNGHTVAASARTSLQADDTAEPFDLDALGFDSEGHTQ